MGGKMRLRKHGRARPEIAHFFKGRLLGVVALIPERNHQRLKLKRTNGSEVLFIGSALVENILSRAVN